MSKRHLITVLIVLSVSATCSSLNILALFPHPGRSHFNVFEPVLKALAAKGHILTVLSPFPQKDKLPRYTDISLEADTKIIFNSFNITDKPKSLLHRYSSLPLLSGIAETICKTLYTIPVQELLTSEEKYDLIITEIFNTDCYLGFVHKFKVPFVGMGPNVLMPWNNAVFANPFHPSYIPCLFLPYTDEMTFWERLENTLLYVVSEVYYKYMIEEPNYEEAKKHFGKDLPHLRTIAKNISVMLVNSHFSLNLPRPFVPNVVEIGGAFVGKPKKLPQDIEKYLNDSPHGVIYFSMGSMLKGYTFPKEKRQIFINAFSKLKQRILWKWEEDEMPGKPQNIMTRKWMPQYDILCHPKVVAFISHGGLLSTTEAVQCGVPVLVMPQYGDQFLNSRALEKNGGGISRNLADLTEESILETLRKLMQSEFQRKAKALSARFRDRPLSPLDTAIFWIEYSARHGNSQHMRTSAVDMPYYQYLLLDVIAFIFVISITVIFVIICLIKYMYKLLFKKRYEKIKTG